MLFSPYYIGYFFSLRLRHYATPIFVIVLMTPELPLPDTAIIAILMAIAFLRPIYWLRFWYAAITLFLPHYYAILVIIY